MTILLIVHGYPPEASGGTEIYVQGLASALAAAGDDVVVLARENDPRSAEYCVRHSTVGGVCVVLINNTFQACNSFADSYRNPALLQVAMREVATIQPDVVHLHHLTCLSTDLPASLAAKGYPMVMTLHDYWLACHRGQLYNLDYARCEGPFDGGCEKCVPAEALGERSAYRAGRVARLLPAPGAEAVTRLGVAFLRAMRSTADTSAASMLRLAQMREAARYIDLFLTPSATLASVFARFGIEPDRMRRHPLGIDLTPFARITRAPSSVLRVGFAGGLMPSKGVHLLLDAAEKLPARSVTVDVLGEGVPFHGDDSYLRSVKPRLALPFVRHVGAVPHERIAEAFAAVDVVAVPSVWLENSPLVIREAFASGAPVVTSNLGGMRELVIDGKDGLLFNPGSVDALRLALQRLISEPHLLARLRDGIRPQASVESDAASLRALYAQLARARAHRPAVNTAEPAPRLQAVVLNYRTPEQTWLAVRSLQTSAVTPTGIAVVENGSGDESAGYLSTRLNGAEIIETGRNLGFAGGCNVGIELGLDGGANFVLLLNSDAVLRPDAIGTLIEAARRHPDAGVLGALILSREEPEMVASAGLNFSNVTARMQHREVGERFTQVSTTQVHDVPAVSGCAMLIRSDVFRRIGTLDVEYFYSFEDLDFCLRARRAGFRVVVVPGAIAYHEGGRSIGRRSATRVYFATRNHLRLAARQLSGSKLIRAARGLLIVAMNGAYAVRSPEVPLVGGLAAVVRGTCDHLRGRYGAGPVA